MSKRRKLGQGARGRVGDADEPLDSTLTTTSTQDEVSTSLGATFSSWRTNSRTNLVTNTLTLSRATTTANSSSSSSCTSCSVCNFPTDLSLSIFCSLPTEILETIFAYLSIRDRLHFFQVLSRGKYLSTKACKALSSASLWRRVKMVARRPDHLVTLTAYPDELLCGQESIPIKLKEQMLRFYPPPFPNNGSLLDLKVFMLRKHSFQLPFDFFLAALLTRRSCSVIRSFSFAVEEIWQNDFYPLQRSDVALDRISQVIDELGPACRELNVVKWPRLQDDTVIDQTYSEMQAHYASSDFSTTDPIIAIITNMHLFANLETFGLFWFDFEDPEFWSISRSDWCTMSHQWAWSEEEFSSGHTLYPTQASREFNVVDGLSNLKELRLTFSSYSDDRYFLDPVFCPFNTLRRLRIMVRSSWNGWDGLYASQRPLGAYWNSLVGKIPNLEVTLTFIEFFDYTKFSDWRILFYPKIPLTACQWLPGSVVTLFALRCVGTAYSQSLVTLDLHTELIDNQNRNDGMALLSDVIKIVRDCHALTRFIFDSSITVHFCKIVARIRKSKWRQLVFFRDRFHESPKAEDVDTFQEGIGKILERSWRFHTNKDREYGPKGYAG